MKVPLRTHQDAVLVSSVCGLFRRRGETFSRALTMPMRATATGRVPCARVGPLCASLVSGRRPAGLFTSSEEGAMRVQDVMTTAVQTISPATPAEEACESDADEGHPSPRRRRRASSGRCALRSGYRRTPRCTRQGESHRERSHDRACGDGVADQDCSPGGESDARPLDRLPVVVGKGRTLGIVTVADLLELVGRGAERPVATTARRLLNHRAPHRKRHVAFGAW